MTPFFGDNVLHIMSFSKAGIPGERVWVVVWSEDLVQKITAFQANASLMSSRFGQLLLSRVIESGELKAVCWDVINNFYQKKQQLFTESLEKYMPKNVTYFRHEGEGTFFWWIWFEGLPLTDKELYVLLKKQHLIVVPWSYFFPGYRWDDSHVQQTIRVSLASDDKKIIEWMKILWRVLWEIYKS
jgi:valine--pyruvate aminotransferase